MCACKIIMQSLSFAPAVLSGLGQIPCWGSVQKQATWGAGVPLTSPSPVPETDCPPLAGLHGLWLRVF